MMQVMQGMANRAKQARYHHVTWNVSLDVKLGSILGPIFVSVALIPEHDYEMSIALLCEHRVSWDSLMDRKVMGIVSQRGNIARVLLRLLSSLLLLPLPSPSPKVAAIR